jgi:hypothetical protein
VTLFGLSQNVATLALEHVIGVEVRRVVLPLQNIWKATLRYYHVGFPGCPLDWVEISVLEITVLQVRVLDVTGRLEINCLKMSTFRIDAVDFVFVGLVFWNYIIVLDVGWLGLLLRLILGKCLKPPVCSFIIVIIINLPA